MALKIVDYYMTCKCWMALFVQKMVKRSRKLVSRLACRDPTNDLHVEQPSPEASAEHSGDFIDDDTPLSQFLSGPETSQPTPRVRRGSRNCRPTVIPTPGTDAIPRRRAPVRKVKAKC
jgi:hypothetical protein